MSSETPVILPEDEILRELAKLAISEDKVIKMDYWLDSLEKEVYIGVEREVVDGKNIDKQRILIRNESEFTSSIVKIYRKKGTRESRHGSRQDYFIIITENSLYVVSADIEIKRIA